jgi:hypothetical protein
MSRVRSWISPASPKSTAHRAGQSNVANMSAELRLASKAVGWPASRNGVDRRMSVDPIRAPFIQ